MGESKINNLSLFGLMLVAVYVGLSGWTVFVAVVIQYAPLLLGSLILNLVLFVAAILTRQSRILLLSWIWLGGDFILAQALLLPRISYVTIVSSAIVILLAVDLSNFLEFLYPMRVRTAEMDYQQYERTWSLLKKHTRSALLFATSAGVLGLVGIAVDSPVVFTPNPTLVISVIVSIVLILTTVLSSEWRTRR